MNLPKDADLFDQINGVHYPKYQFWWDWIEGLGLNEMAAEAIWTELLQRWVSHLKSDLGGQFFDQVENDFIFLTSMNKAKLKLLIGFAQRVKTFIKENIVTEFSDGSPILVITFEEYETYQNYIAPIYAMGGAEPAPSAGVFLSGHTYPHIAFIEDNDISVCQSVLAHELTHFYLGAYQVPRWIDEGLALYVSKEFACTPTELLTEESLRQFTEFWRLSNLETFWNGEAFWRNDGTEKFAYQLAEILVKNLLSLEIEKVQKFIKESNSDDGGRSVAQKTLNIDLDNLVFEILNLENY